MDQKVKGTRRWRVIHTKDYLETFPDKRLAEHSAWDVADFTGLSTKDRILDWQFRQAVHTIQILFGLVKPVWFESFDWDYWFYAARSLSPAIQGKVELQLQGVLRSKELVIKVSAIKTIHENSLLLFPY